MMELFIGVVVGVVVVVVVVFVFVVFVVVVIVVVSVDAAFLSTYEVRFAQNLQVQMTMLTTKLQVAPPKFSTRNRTIQTSSPKLVNYTNSSQLKIEKTDLRCSSIFLHNVDMHPITCIVMFFLPIIVEINQCLVGFPLHFLSSDVHHIST